MRAVSCGLEVLQVCGLGVAGALHGATPSDGYRYLPIVWIEPRASHPRLITYEVVVNFLGILMGLRHCTSE